MAMDDATVIAIIVAPLKGRAFKIEISKVSGSALVAEICAGPHNRLLRRQHCSSLCSQSEGHEHAANMANALAHDFVGFLTVLSRHNIRGPHFASKVSYNAAPRSLPQEIRQFVVTLVEAKTEIRCPIRRELRSPV